MTTSVVVVLWVLWTLGIIGVAAAALAVWRQRMRESLPAPSAMRHFRNVGGERHDHATDRSVSAAACRDPRAA